jgi:outer membrane protein
LAESNLANTRRILTIAETKFELGKITKNEILQLQLEVLNAQKASGSAKRDIEISTLNLVSFAGIDPDNKIILEMPSASKDIEVSTDRVLKEALENRSEAIAFVRRLAEAKRDVAKAKGENGLKATLAANLGFSNAGSRVFDVYRSPKSQQSVEIQLSIPVLDWGRSKSRTKTAEANEQFTSYSVQQDQQIFRQQIITEVTLYNMMKEQIKLTVEAERIAVEKYKIATERYVLGNLGITDLSIAFQENDRAKRDYVTSMHDFWAAFYQLRYLSLYDFERNQKITY